MGSKQYNDEQEKVIFCSDWSDDDSEEVSETQVINSARNYPTAIPETIQNIHILPDEDFDEMVQADLQVIKQV
jgi:hypothetical protein